MTMTHDQAHGEPQ